MTLLALTPLQKTTIQSIVNIFETGTVRGDYANITLLRGDTGGLTYGRSQTTRNSGNLYLLIRDYCGTDNARYAEELRPYLPRLQSRDSSLDRDARLRTLLKAAGANDPVMRQIQDSFFDRVYWQSAAKAADAANITTALGIATVYDGFIHGSWSRMAKRATAATGVIEGVESERAWVAAYIDVRRRWLLQMPPPLPNTVYRMTAFRQLIEAGNWSLALPLTIRGMTVSLETMGIEAKGWTVIVGKKQLGETWQNPADEYRNYYPVRELLLALFTKEEVTAGLRLDKATNTIIWAGKPLAAPFVERNSGAVWVQLRGFAGAMGLTVARDEDLRTLTLRRARPIAYKVAPKVAGAVAIPSPTE